MSRSKVDQGFPNLTQNKSIVYKRAEGLSLSTALKMTSNISRRDDIEDIWNFPLSKHFVDLVLTKVLSVPPSILQYDPTFVDGIVRDEAARTAADRVSMSASERLGDVEVVAVGDADFEERDVVPKPKKLACTRSLDVRV